MNSASDVSKEVLYISTGDKAMLFTLRCKGYEYSGRQQIRFPFDKFIMVLGADEAESVARAKGYASLVNVKLTGLDALPTLGVIVHNNFNSVIHIDLKRKSLIKRLKLLRL